MTTPARETEQQRIDRIVNEVLSGRRSMASVRQSVDRLAGREPGDYSNVDDSRFQTREQLAQRVRDIFVNRGVRITPAPASTTERADERVARIANEVLSGQRSLNDVRASLDRLAGRPPGDYSGVDDSAFLRDPAALRRRIEQMFVNRGLGIGVAPSGASGPSRGPAAGGEPAPRPGTPGAPERPDEREDRERRQAEERAQRDSYARLQRVLDEYGLGSLGATVQRWLVEGLSEAEIVQRMRETNEFRTRFPAIEQRRQAGLAPLSPGEYVAYERNAAQLLRAAGLPQGFYDSSEDFTRFLVNDMSLAELGDRVTLAANAAFRMPQEDRDALVEWGLGPGDLTAFWLDPDKAQPLLERKYAAAQLAGTARRAAFGSLTEETATNLATLGVTQQQAEQGFGQLAESRELFTGLDRTEDTIDQGTQLGAMFEGNAAARRRIEQRRRKRQAAFEGGGGFASGQTGLAGLGDASGT
jgi:hypothetical protein